LDRAIDIRYATRLFITCKSDFTNQVSNLRNVIRNLIKRFTRLI
jgi:hypothetical protein